MLGRLSLNLETWDSSLDFHPGILDGAIQLLLLACSSSDSQQCFLPFSIDNCVIATALRSRDVWVTVLVRTVSAEAVSGDVEISTDDGVLIARLSRLSCRARDRRPKLPESKQQPQQPQLEQMYSVAFVEMESPGTETETATDAVVWCSEERQGELLAALSWKAEICSFARDETTALNLLGSSAAVHSPPCHSLSLSLIFSFSRDEAPESLVTWHSSQKAISWKRFTTLCKCCRFHRS